MRRVLGPLSLLVALISFAVAAPSAAAQDATPGAGAAAFPITPDPDDCTAEPRAADELLALWYDPAGTPIAGPATPAAEPATSVAVPLGPPADAATAAAVADTVSGIFACFAAGDALRAYAYFTDDLARQFGPEPGTPREEAEAFLAAPLAGEEGEDDEPGDGEAGGDQILAVTDVMDLPDGRVGAFAVSREEGQLDSVYIVLERRGDRLVAAELIDFAPIGDGGEDEGE